MYYGQTFNIWGLSWAQIHFVENEGMAYGLKFGGETGKLILTSFRIIMVILLSYMLGKMIKGKEPLGFLIFFSLIIAGALGNIIDSVFYGVIFSGSPYLSTTVATMFPESGGYSKLLHGWVVDMLHFPLIDTTFPEWMPLVGGSPFRFFRPVFNIADVSISTGVIGILLFYRKFFTQKSVAEGNVPVVVVNDDASKETIEEE